MTQSLAIVAFAADQPLSPRGERARAVAAAGRRVAETRLIGPEGAAAVRRRSRRTCRVASPWLLDAWEPEAVWALRRLRARPDVGLLVGFPFSGVYWGSRWLARAGVPYVVDLGDPWRLTLPPGQRPPMGGLRAARCEAYVWRHASGAILTTRLQAEAVRRLFPHLPVAVRPNGYRSVSQTVPADPGRDPTTLRLVHYGNLYAPRLDIAPLLSGLAACGRWRSIVVTQQGEDWTGVLRRLPATVRVELRRPSSWDTVISTAAAHDVAIVLGNRNPAQLPSKAVQYLSLPIPRLAIVGDHPDDALRAYVRDKPGWLTLGWDIAAPAAGAAVAAHLARGWGQDELAPPPGESWEAVAAEVVEFTLGHADVRDPRADPAAQLRSRAMAAASNSQPR